MLWRFPAIGVPDAESDASGHATIYDNSGSAVEFIVETVTAQKLTIDIAEIRMFYRPGKDDHGLPHDPFKVQTSNPGQCTINFSV